MIFKIHVYVGLIPSLYVVELQGLFDSSQSAPLQPLQPLVVSQPHPAPLEMTPQTTTPPSSSLSPPMKQVISTVTQNGTYFWPCCVTLYLQI